MGIIFDKKQQKKHYEQTNNIKKSGSFKGVIL